MIFTHLNNICNGCDLRDFEIKKMCRSCNLCFCEKCLDTNVTKTKNCNHYSSILEVFNCLMCKKQCFNKCMSCDCKYRICFECFDYKIKKDRCINYHPLKWKNFLKTYRQSKRCINCNKGDQAGLYCDKCDYFLCHFCGEIQY